MTHPDMHQDLVYQGGKFRRSGACCVRLTVYSNRQEAEHDEEAVARVTKHFASIVRKFGRMLTEAEECASATIRTWVPCGLSFVLVETCCDGLTPPECAAAHEAAVEEVEEICEGM